MLTKVCSKCKIEKEICEFYSHRKECIDCRKKYNKKYYQNNTEKIKEQFSENKKKDRKKYLEIKKKTYQKNKEKILEKKKQKYSENREEKILKVKEYSEKNSDKIKKRKKKYYQKTKEIRNTYYKEKYKTDVFYKLGKIVRKRILDYLKIEQNVVKKQDILGCSIEFLKEHIEKQFTKGMSWELLGKEIHIDHIIPLSSAKTEEEIYKLCHYSNLQPLWAKENLSKGSKIIDYSNFKPSEAII
jgi:hypothetical protein